jgi:hypothetical protein
MLRTTSMPRFGPHCFQHFGDVFRGSRLAEEETLHFCASFGAYNGKLLHGLDAFRGGR